MKNLIYCPTLTFDCLGRQLSSWETPTLTLSVDMKRNMGDTGLRWMLNHTSLKWAKIIPGSTARLISNYNRPTNSDNIQTHARIVVAQAVTLLQVPTYVSVFYSLVHTKYAECTHIVSWMVGVWTRRGFVVALLEALRSLQESTQCRVSREIVTLQLSIV